MRDLMRELCQARIKLPNWSEERLYTLVREIGGACTDVQELWHRESGEEWVLFVKGKESVGMLGTRLPIGFFEESFLSRLKNVGSLQYIHTVSYTDPLEKWCVDLQRLRDMVPELSWEADPRAVDPGSFTLGELLYATN